MLRIDVILMSIRNSNPYNPENLWIKTENLQITK